MDLMLIGKSTVIAESLLASSPRMRLHVLDHANELDGHMRSAANMVSFHAYESPEQLEDICRSLSATCAIEAVIPAFERTVRDANRAARLLALPRIGDIGAHIFRDKGLLREFCAMHGINQPDSRIVNTPDDLRRMLIEHPGRTLIVKPTTLSASMGVLRVERADQADQSFSHARHVLDSEGGTGRIIAESFVPGRECSCELAVDEGRIVWGNVTTKFTYGNGNFVESGHLVPAIVAPQVRDEILRMTARLAREAQVGTAILHAEWIVGEKGGPYLIECAGRRPGDRIVDLIDLAYAMDTIRTYCLMMAGRHPEWQCIAHRFAEQRYFEHTPGTVTGISHPELLEGLTHRIDITVGDRLGVIDSSQARVGYVIMDDHDPLRLERRMRRILNDVHIETAAEAVSPPRQSPHQ